MTVNGGNTLGEHTCRPPRLVPFLPAPFSFSSFCFLSPSLSPSSPLQLQLSSVQCILVYHCCFTTTANTHGTRFFGRILLLLPVFEPPKAPGSTLCLCRSPAAMCMHHVPKCRVFSWHFLHFKDSMLPRDTTRSFVNYCLC